MTRIKNYRKVASLEEAWLLNQKKSNRIIGGMLWLRQMDLSIDTAIDLSGLGLDKIEETEEEFSIGSMVTLHQMETDAALNAYTSGAAKEAVAHIVGVQFRNMATIGGSVSGRYGFSDVITFLLALDASVHLYKGGVVSLSDYLYSKRDNDIITAVSFRKAKGSMAYQSVRAQATDFPTLTCCAFAGEGRVSLAIGARPGKAVLLKKAVASLDAGTIAAIAKEAQETITTGSNLKGSAAYRTHLIGVLSTRALECAGGKA